jgi:hypothetical protein
LSISASRSATSRSTRGPSINRAAEDHSDSTVLEFIDLTG